METDLKQFIEKHVDKIKPIIKELYMLHWQYDTTGNESLVPRKNALEVEYRNIYSDKESFIELKSIARENNGKEPQLKRQADLLLHAFQLYQGEEGEIKKMVELSSEINSIYNHYRGRIDGQEHNDNQLKNILRYDMDNELRRKAWEASKQVGSEVGDKVLELVRLRNENAQKAGYDNYYQMALACKEIDEKELFDTLGNLKDLTDAPFKEFKQNLDKERAKLLGIEPQEMRPWHYGDPFFQEVPPRKEIEITHFFKDRKIEDLTRTTYSSIGLEIDDILQNSDLYPKEGKCQHAFCTMIDKDQRDIRVLCNIDQNQYWVNTMLHEYGHAVYDKYIGRDLPYLLQDAAHTLSTEAIAMLMDSLSNDSEWLVEIAQAPEPEVSKIAKLLVEQEQRGELVFIRWGLVMVHFERALYHDPEQDLNSLWWDYVEKFQMVRRPEHRDAPDWAGKIHLALAPVYYQNYLYGLLVASQLHQHIKNNVGNGKLFNNPELGPYFIDRYFKSGARFDWKKTLEQATGEKLNPKYCVELTLGR